LESAWSTKWIHAIALILLPGQRWDAGHVENAGCGYSQVGVFRKEYTGARSSRMARMAAMNGHR
jgi:hypothetical protein